MTYVSKANRLKHVPRNHAKFETPEIRKRRAWIMALAVAAGPIILVGGLIGIWFLVAWAIVLLFKFLPLFKA